MCQSQEDGGRRCPDGRRFRSANFTSADLAPAVTPGRPPIKWRSEPLETVKKKWPSHVLCAACKTLERHQDAEDRITGSLERSVPSGAHLEGLEYRMKSPDSVCEKIHRKRTMAGRQGQPIPTSESTAEEMKDVLRYTIVSDDHESLTDNALHVADSLVNDGWKITEAENMFVSGNSYKGLHLTVQDKTGLSVEVQVHSTESIATKEQSHKLYEEQRDSSTSPGRRRELGAEMKRMADALANPPGLSEITKIGGCEVREIVR